MKINYNVTGPKRKALVEAITQELGIPVKYLGAPTFAYEVGNYIIDKSGVLEGKDNPGLVADLLEIHDFKAATEEYNTSFPEEESTSLIIELPRVDFTDVALENLKGLVESKETLIKNALGIDSVLVMVGEETISFSWFSGDLVPDEIKAYTHFIAALAEMAKKQKRVNTTQKAVENEKYAFRCFLLRLGFIGPEYKTVRKILLSKLTGSSAFRSSKTRDEAIEQ